MRIILVYLVGKQSNNICSLYGSSLNIVNAPRRRVYTYSYQYRVQSIITEVFNQVVLPQYWLKPRSSAADWYLENPIDEISSLSGQAFRPLLSSRTDSEISRTDDITERSRHLSSKRTCEKIFLPALLRSNWCLSGRLISSTPSLTLPILEENRAGTVGKVEWHTLPS